MTAESKRLLILLRHGQAEPYRVDDASRALVSAGVDEVEKSARFLHEQGWLPQRIIASPYRRAQQTAEIVKKQLQPTLCVEAEVMLQPDGEAAVTASLLSTLADRPLLVATHMPLVAALLRSLSGHEGSFATGALAVLKHDGEHWRLLARFDPNQT